MKKKIFIIIMLSVIIFPSYSQRTSSSDAGNKSSYRDVSKKISAAIFKPGSSEKYSAEFTSMRRVFDIQGIPYKILEDAEEIFDYELAFISGPLNEKNIRSDIINTLYDYVEGGGVLFTSGEISKRLHPLFGVKEYIPSKNRYRMTFRGDDPVFVYLDEKEERTISLGNGEDNFYKDVIWSHGYVVDEYASVLGRFKDKTAGFIKNSYGRGTAYLLGLSFVESIMLPQVGDDYEAQRLYVNSFEPSADSIMLIVKALYQHHNSKSLIIGTTPYLKNPVLVLSHDVDAQTSFVDSLKYAELEKKFGVTSTFFENTKYFTDYLDIDYYNIKENVDAIRKLKKMGWDIGSHTVSHYKKLSKAELGEKDVTFENYEPLKRKTVRGEVAVSKELLDRDIPDQDTVSFRAGDLEYHSALIKVLEEYGYLYDSTFSSNDILTSFPYYAFRERFPGSPETDIIEIPVTLDDSLGFLTPETVDKAVKVWKRVVLLNSSNSAITTLLIHPSDTRDSDHKLRAQEKLMNFVVARDGWMGNLTEIGEFWRNRSKIDFSLIEDNGDYILKINNAEIDPRVGFIASGFNGSGFTIMDSGGKILDYTTEKSENSIKIYKK